MMMMKIQILMLYLDLMVKTISTLQQLMDKIKLRSLTGFSPGVVGAPGPQRRSEPGSLRDAGIIIIIIISFNCIALI